MEAYTAPVGHHQALLPLVEEDHKGHSRFSQSTSRHKRS